MAAVEVQNGFNKAVKLVCRYVAYSGEQVATKGMKLVFSTKKKSSNKRVIAAMGSRGLIDED